MYLLCVIRYTKPIEEVGRHLEAHRHYLGQLKQQGLVVCGGPLDPLYGGLVLYRVPDSFTDEQMNQLRDEDPYVKNGVAQYEMMRWNVLLGREDLDRA